MPTNTALPPKPAEPARIARRIAGAGATPLALALALALTGPATGQDVSDCDWRTDMRFIAEPWEANTRTFANGAVRLVLLDTVEPAAVPFQIVVISPPYGEEGWRQCKAIGNFYGVDFAALSARYDPATGLSFTVPVTIYDGSDEGGYPAELLFTLNQATGLVTAEVD